MKAWYSKVRDTELIDGSVRADYVVTFETDNFELKRKVEKYLQGIMDEAEQTEPSFKVDEIGDNDPTIHAIAYLQKVGWLQEHDRALTEQTENSSEIPNNCEPQTMYYPQVDGITPSVIMPKDEPQTDWKDQMWTEAIEDEPQTERSE